MASILKIIAFIVDLLRLFKTPKVVKDAAIDEKVNKEHDNIADGGRPTGR